jgi:hypothetical protein
MPNANAKADPHVQKAVSFLQRCPAASLKEGMLIAGFLKKISRIVQRKHGSSVATSREMPTQPLPHSLLRLAYRGGRQPLKKQN